MRPDRKNANWFVPATRKSESSRIRRALDFWLGRLGPTWRASPLRRVAQTGCLGLFLYLIFYVCWPYAEVFDQGVMARKEWLPVESLLWIDPLVGLSTAIAARCINPALVAGAVFLVAVCLAVPRVFCGYICPLGTLIDLFDGLLGRFFGRFSRRRADRPTRTANAWWMHLKYYLLVGVLVSSGFGVLISGYVAAIPVVTRAMVFMVSPAQLLWLKGPSQVRPFEWGDVASVGLFAAIFLLGVFAPRFWCRYVCPSGALFSVASLVRVGHRHLEATCIGCGQCTRVCPFDAIRDDFTTRPLDCTWCQTCGGVCPEGSIRFATRFGSGEAEAAGDRPVIGPKTSRRGFVISALSGTAAALAIPRIGPARNRPMEISPVETSPGARSSVKTASAPLLRPPGSVLEANFLELCIRCGLCFQVCPGPVLHPANSSGGLDALWTPVAVPSHAGCHQDCNHCTQVCPTGAIRPLSIQQKRKTRMGLAKIDTEHCLAHAGEAECRLCLEECTASGYNAIRMEEIRLELADVPEGIFSDTELDAMSRIEAPVVDRDACVGCGLCEYRCNAVLVKRDKELHQPAVVIVGLRERRR